MTFSGLIFDLDGTLLDSLPDLTLAANVIRNRLGLEPVDADRVRACVGDGARKLLERLLPEELFSDERLAQFLAIYRQHLTDQTRPFEGIPQLLERLSGHPRALITNKPVEMAREILDRLDLARHFSVVFGGDSFPEKKPHPRPLLETLKRLGTPAATTLMIGDHHTDLYAARAADMPFCFCRWGYGHTDGETADFEAGSVADLARLLGADL
ncbi:MAG: HAD family hydrolase [Deltaproteobacteria bacterium]|nr:MAG: HAD family hydrolase [Deltaproteobacteria bacterium]